MTSHDLSETYTAVEHKVPNVVFVTSHFAKQPEFEVMLLLFKALSVRCVIVSETQAFTPSEEAISQRFGLHLMNRTAVAEYSVRSQGGTALNRVAAPQTGTAGERNVFDDGFILLGASTGGVDALIRVLSSFPTNCPPTYIVQHTGAQFTRGLAKLVNGHVPPAVVEFDGSSRPKPGVVTFAPGGTTHLVFHARNRNRVQLIEGEPKQGHRPSVDMLFSSAVPHASQISAALLTGMGRDGAEGLLGLRKAKARTFAQDEQTSIVYGMPKAAQELGAPEKQLPLDAIGPALLKSRRRPQHAV